MQSVYNSPDLKCLSVDRDLTEEFVEIVKLENGFAVSTLNHGQEFTLHPLFPQFVPNRKGDRSRVCRNYSNVLKRDGSVLGAPLKYLNQ